jgi:hypothetical protein
MSQAKNVNTTSPSRRAVLAGIAATPALAAPALVLSGPDPIFAAIENHRKLDADFLTLARSEDRLLESGIKLLPAPGDHRTPEMVAAVDASVNARQSLANTVPTTAAGLAAYLDYLLTESVVLGDFFFDGDDEALDFLESLHSAVRGMNGLSAAEAAS